MENQKHPQSKWQQFLGTRCDWSDDQIFKAKESKLKFLSSSEKTAILTIGIPDRSCKFKTLALSNSDTQARIKTSTRARQSLFDASVFC